MPLTLSFHAGDDFYVGEERFVVEDVNLAKGCRVSNEDGETFEIWPDAATSVTEDCKISEGHRVIMGKTRLVFMAPKSVRILRGENKEPPDAAEDSP